MTRATGPRRPTIEEQLRSAHGVLQLVADLCDLQTVAPDYARQGLSSAASATLARLCRRHGDALQVVLDGSPAEIGNASTTRTRPRRTRAPSDDTT